MNLILTGMRGSGKTTLGKALSKNLGWAFRDLDEWLEQKVKKTCHELVMSDGWRKFREEEKKAVENCDGLEKVVIATGGGTLMDPQNAATLKKNGFVILLVADCGTLKKHIESSHERPALTEAGKKTSALEELEAVWEARKAQYHAVADLVHNTTHGMDLDGLLKKLYGEPRLGSVLPKIKKT